MLHSSLPPEPLTQVALDQHEAECFDVYSRCAQGALAGELETLLNHIVELRRELHRMLIARQVAKSATLTQQLLWLEAQAAAARRVCGDIPLPSRAAPAGPQDRRKERRRTARE